MAKNSSKILIVLVVILILGFVGYIVWNSYFRGQTKKSEVNQEEQKQEEKIVYENEDYGFKLELPETWEGYKTSGLKTATPAGSTNLNGFDVIFFELDSKTVFQIDIVAEKWEEFSKKEIDKLSGSTESKYIGENGGWLFFYRINNNSANKGSTEQIEDVEKITATFEVTGQPQIKAPTEARKSEENKDSTCDTCSWSTYNNSKDKYSFKYPSDWFVLETDDEGVVVTNFKYPMEVGRELNLDETKITVNATENASNMSAKEWVDAVGYDKENIKKQSDIKVAGTDAVKIEAEDLGHHIDVYFPKNGKMFEITNFSNSDKLDQILSTFNAD